MKGENQRLFIVGFLLIFSLIVVELIFNTTPKEITDKKFEVDVLSPSIHQGEPLLLSIKLDEVDKEYGTIIDYELYVDNILYSAQRDIVYQERVLKEFPTEKNYKPGYYYLTISIIDGSQRSVVLVPFKIMGFGNVWVYIMVFIVLIILLHEIVIKFNETKFHIEKTEFKRFHDLLKALHIQDYYMAKMYFDSLTESYHKLKKRPHVDKKRIDDLYEHAKTKIEKIRVHHMIKEFDNLYKDLLKYKDKDKKRKIAAIYDIFS
jgi:hypothetical protein